MQTKLKTSGYRILINGKPLPANFISLITQISVQQELNVPSMFTISLTDLSFNQPGWQGIELDTFKPGDIISIAMGIEHYETLFIGQITALEPSFSNEAMLEVRGYDCMYWLKFGKYSRSFIKKTDGEIVAQIAKEVGIDVQVENTPLVNAYVLQNDQSNYDFLLQRLAQINYEMLVDGKKLIFRSSQEGMTPVKELRYPAEVSDLNLRLKVSTEGNKLTVVGWDVGKKQVVKAEVDSPSTKAKMGGQATGDSLASRVKSATAMEIGSSVTNVNAAKIIATAQYNLALEQFIEGSGRCGGKQKIKIGSNIRLSGLGKRFSGIYYVTACTHSYEQTKGYHINFAVSRMGI